MMKNQIFTSRAFVILLMSLLLNSFYDGKAYSQGSPILGNTSTQPTVSGSGEISPGTGTMVYTIPLLNIERAGVNLPISLIYEANGIKPNEYGSWVGQGWQLSTGGTMNRVTNGYPDDQYPRTIEATPVVTILSPAGYLQTGNTSPPYITDYYNPSNSKPRIDFLPDLFVVNSPLVSGSFNIKRKSSGLPGNGSQLNDFQYVDYSKSMTKMSFNTDAEGRIMGFQIKNQNGVTCDFSVPEITKVKMSQWKPEWEDMDIANSWHLKSIHSDLEDDVFVFNYHNENVRDHYSMHYLNYYASKTRSLHEEMDATIGGYNVQVSHPRYLHKIFYDDNESYVEFVLQVNERSDLPGNKLLRYIRQYENGVLIVQHELFYFSQPTPDAEDKRYFLDRIETRYTLTEGLPAASYKEFDYNFSAGIAKRTSQHMDYWGYTSNPSAANGLFPHQDLLPHGATNLWGSGVGYSIMRKFKGNKVDLEATNNSKAGVLTSITHSEGKIEEFEYGLNEYSYEESLENPIENAAFDPDGFDESSPNINGDWGFLHFSSDIPQWVEIRFNKNGGCSDNGRITVSGQSINLPSGEYVWVFVDAGNYSVSPHIGTNTCPAVGTAPTINVRKKSHLESESESFRKKGGGIRIEKMITRDGNGRGYARNFIYDEFPVQYKGTSLKSSGILTHIPNQMFISAYAHLHSVTRPIYTQSNGSNIAGVLRSTGPVIYTNVEEYTCVVNATGACTTDGRDHIGSTRRTFEYSPLPDKALLFPFLPDMTDYHKRVVLTDEEVLDATGATVEHIKYNYAEVSFSAESINGYQEYVHQYHENDGSIKPQWYEAKAYTNYPELNRLTSKVITVSEAGEDQVTTESYMYTSNKDVHEPVRIDRVMPDGSVMRTRTSYVGTIVTDPEASPSNHMTEAIFALYENGRFGLPVEMIVYLKRAGESTYRPIDHNVNVYHQLNDGRVVLKKTVNKPINDGANEIRNLEGLSFDDTEAELDIPILTRDLVTEVSNYNSEHIPGLSIDPYGMETSYLFDETGRRKIAKINNALISECKYTSFEHLSFPSGTQQNSEGGWIIMSIQGYCGPEPASFPAGDLGVCLSAFSVTSEGSLPLGSYIVSFWRHINSNVNVGGAGVALISSVEKDYGDWIYVEKVIEVTAFLTSAVVTGTGYIDELKLMPIDAQMKSYGYYPNGILRFTSNNHVINHFEYDHQNRPTFVLDEELHVVSYTEYSNKNPLNNNSFNVIKQYNPKVDGLIRSEFLSDKEDNDIQLNKVFLDGLGRKRQAWHLRANNKPGVKHKVQHFYYDDFGRENRSYLPYYKAGLTMESGFITNVSSELFSYYQNLDDPQENTSYPYVEKDYEESPRQRVIKSSQIGEGYDMDSGNTTQYVYNWNTTNDNILWWKYDPTNSKVTSTSIYPSNTLKKVEVINPEGVRTWEFVDARGNAVARSQEAEVGEVAGFHYTGNHQPILTTEIFTDYLVYDDMGRLVYEIPREAVERMNGNNSLDPADPSNVYNELITHYKYDTKGRLVAKKSPGIQETHYVYDDKDRVILSQDAQQRVDGIWDFIKRDKLGRVILEGYINSSLTRIQHQDLANANSTTEESIIGDIAGHIELYSNNAYPILNMDTKGMRVYYYDDYAFNNITAFSFAPFTGQSSRLQMTRNLPTGTKVRILLPNGQLGDFLTIVVYYNNDFLPIQTYTQNHKGGFDKVNISYDEYNQVERQEQIHKYDNNSDEVIFTTRFRYHNNTRELLNTWCKINDDPEVMVSRRWYDNGKLKSLGLHRDNSANYMQHIDYRYNVQGNLTHINNATLTIDAYNDEDYDVFGQQLLYHDLDPNIFPFDVQNSDVDLTLRHDGLISAMMWNAKTGEEDGTTLRKNVYTYDYDDFGQMISSYYAADHPSLPGEFNAHVGHYNEELNYDLGGNIKRLWRNYKGKLSPVEIDDLVYTYSADGYKLNSVIDLANQQYSSSYKHFIDGSGINVEYSYDANARVLEDFNKGVRFYYNHIGTPRRISKSYSSVFYTYDAAGNKLQKHNVDNCPPDILCADIDEEIDYIGNFVYRHGELEMIYHPEGVLRPTPVNAENETEFVYDYFIKDYLGNVRVVITEENATYTQKFLATMEEVHALIEEENFDNVNETREELPTGYPLNGSVNFNERIALLSEENGTEMGPSLAMPVMRGDKVSLQTDYFYTEDASGATYNNFDLLLNDVLIALAASASGVVRLGEAQLLDIASGNWSQTAMLEDLLADNFDTTDVSKPYAYLVWVLYDHEMKIIPTGSGAKRVVNPNDLEQLIEEDIAIAENGYLHTYVMNGTANGAVSFDNFLVSYLRGKTRQINHYYPYGLSISGLGGDHDEYLNKYTGKELQTGEFHSIPETSGLEMFDFHARFYDPQLGRWFTPDPAEQFSNPYLGIGNNPVMYVDPDGRAAMLLPLIVAGGIVAGSFQQASTGNDGFNQLLIGGAIGGAAAAAGYGAGASVAGAGFIGGAASGAVGGFAGGFTGGSASTWYNGGSFYEGMSAGLKSGVVAAAGGAVLGGIAGGFSAKNAGLDFWTGELTDIEKFLAINFSEDFVASTSNLAESNFPVKLDGTEQEAFNKMASAMKKAISRLRSDPNAINHTLSEYIDLESVTSSPLWKNYSNSYANYYSREFTVNNFKIKMDIIASNEFIKSYDLYGSLNSMKSISLMHNMNDHLARISFRNHGLHQRVVNAILGGISNSR